MALILARRLWWAAFLALVLVFAYAMSSGSPSIHLSPNSHSTDGTPVGKSEGPVSFAETVDSGDDPVTPGCLGEYAGQDCPGEPFVFFGDECVTGESGMMLFETTTPMDCQLRPETTFYECNRHCQSLGFIGGACVTVEDVCPNGEDSAFCDCFVATAP